MPTTTHNPDQTGTTFTSFMNRGPSDKRNLTIRGRKRTKVVATLGPASENDEVLREMYHAGMNVARLNMSHGDQADHSRRLNLVRDLSNEMQRPVAALMDLQGPKIRLGRFDGGQADWVPGAETVITVDDVEAGDKDRVSTTYKRLANDVIPGNTILVDDGRLRLEVLDVTGNDIRCKIIVGGLAKSSKGINLPGVNVSAPALSDKDKKDLEWGIENDVDYIALSFVSNAGDIRSVRRRVQEAGKNIPIIAKIERDEAVDNMESIIEETDGIMVARGDLGIELGTQRLPVIQKHLIARANAHGKFVITATQMLESMIENPIPTRAESNDVANAIFDGTDAVMLSAETAAGDYPVQAVNEMLAIAVEAEDSPYMSRSVLEDNLVQTDQTTLALTGAAAHLAKKVGAVGVLSFGDIEQTELLAKFRSAGKIIPICHNITKWRRLAAIWGTIALRVDKYDSDQDALDAGIREAKRQDVLNEGDTVVALFGRAGSKTLRIITV